jgi:hypothetical protein
MNGTGQDPGDQTLKVGLALLAGLEFLGFVAAITYWLLR